MRKIFVCLVGAAALTSLGACQRGSGSAPSGQVVAKIGSDEITQRELNAELNGFSSQDPALTKNAENAAITAIANRKLFADAGRKAGLEKSAYYQLARQRADDLLLAQSYEQQIVSKLPQPTTDEAEQYVKDHPNNFAERKIFLVDQIQIPKDTDPKLLQKITPLHSMDDIEQVLLSAGTDYIRAPSSIDARTTPADAVDQILRLPPNEPFVLPLNGGLTINQVTDSKTVPFTGPAAVEAARRTLYSLRASKAIDSSLAELRKSAGGIHYQAGYGPASRGKPVPSQEQKH